MQICTFIHERLPTSGREVESIASRFFSLNSNAQNKMRHIKHGESLRIYPLIPDFRAPMLATEVETSIAKSMVSYILGLR
jgi:hypothetical protein